MSKITLHLLIVSLSRIYRIKTYYNLGSQLSLNSVRCKELPLRAGCATRSEETNTESYYPVISIRMQKADKFSSYSSNRVISNLNVSSTCFV